VLARQFARTSITTRGRWHFCDHKVEKSGSSF
jgi:hypothetical protein